MIKEKEKEIFSIIERNLQLWNFDLVESIYYTNYKLSVNIETKFYNFLYLTGNIGKYILEEERLNDEILYTRKILLNGNINYQNIKDNLYERVSKDILSCYLLNKNFYFCDTNDSIDNLLDLYKNYIHGSSNIITRNYFIATLIRFCVILGKQELFYIKEGFDLRYYLLQKMYDINTSGSKIYHSLFIDELQDQLKNGNIKSEVKFAICMYGMLRGDWKGTLEKNIKIAKEQLNADIFLFTWSKKQDWQNITTGGDCWVDRKLAKDFFQESPKEILKTSDLKKNMPNVFSRLNHDIFSKYNYSELKNLIEYYENFRGLLVEDQQKVQQDESLSSNIEFMYYAIYKSFKILEKYEESNNIKYDYIIHMRVDSEILIEGCLKNEIIKLRSNNIYDLKTLAGNGVGNVVGSRNVINIYSSLYVHRKFYKNLMIANTKDPHEMFFKWLSFNGIYSIKPNFKIEHRYTKAQNGYIMPDISKELYLDLLNLRDKFDTKKLDKFIYFFQKVTKKYCKEKLTDSVYFSAKSRIKNHLAYQFGLTMIQYSRNILGYVKMPFILFETFRQYQNKKKEYYERISENPKFILPKIKEYADYQEAIKLKESITYRLGQALIQAN
ncbi:TPA: hypothetical protein SHR52_000720, partial [Campylobacter jejuni]|nr:capsular biosynthesis protein [Campylobacter jejuni]HEH6141755.1 hypothetical protein [Campylobacter jejuni]